jgi:hypothetical protein
VPPPVVERAARGLRPGHEVRLVAPPRRVELFLTRDGSDPRAAGSGESSPSAERHTGPAVVALTATTRLKARQRVGDEWSPLVDRLFVVGSDRLPLRFGELMYHPPEAEAEEFIEIENISAAPIELDGLRLEGVRFFFAPGSVLAGGAKLVLAPDDDPERFARRYQGVTVVGHYGGHLSNGGERLALVEADGTRIDAVRYGDKDPWPPEADGGGYSLVRVAERTPTTEDDPKAWQRSAKPGGTPGR